MKFFIIALLFLAVDGKAKKGKGEISSEELYSQALRTFEAKRFRKSAELFQKFVFQFPLSDSVDDAQYFLAKSYKEAKDYENAITEYLFLITTFPTSERAPEAYLDLAECYLQKNKNIGKDTQDLLEALKYISEFKSRFPDSPLMDRARDLEYKINRIKGEKYLYIAKTYLNIGAPKSALVYLDLVQNEFENDEEMMKEALLLRAEAKIQQKNCQEAENLLKEVVSRFPSDKKVLSRVKSLERLKKKRCKE